VAPGGDDTPQLATTGAALGSLRRRFAWTSIKTARTSPAEGVSAVTGVRPFRRSRETGGVQVPRDFGRRR
jgi:hypothetical protein